MSALSESVAPLLAEVEAVFRRMPSDALKPFVEAIAGADRILLYGQGRTGLMMQGLTMRLHHLGLDAHWVGAMSTPP
ncbi:MAG: 6-phospho-3-hexuloisomerase, partial [Elsteraceae bacterium]